MIESYTHPAEIANTVRRLKSTVRHLDKNARPRARPRVAQTVPARPIPPHPCVISICHIPASYPQCISLWHTHLPYPCGILAMRIPASYPITICLRHPRTQPSYDTRLTRAPAPRRPAPPARGGWGANFAQRFIYICLPPIFAQFLVLSTLYPGIKSTHYPRVPRPLLTP